MHFERGDSPEKREAYCAKANEAFSQSPILSGHNIKMVNSIESARIGYLDIGIYYVMGKSIVEFDVKPVLLRGQMNFNFIVKAMEDFIKGMVSGEHFMSWIMDEDVESHTRATLSPFYDEDSPGYIKGCYPFFNETLYYTPGEMSISVLPGGQEMYLVIRGLHSDARGFTSTMSFSFLLVRDWKKGMPMTTIGCDELIGFVQAVCDRDRDTVLRSSVMEAISLTLASKLIGSESYKRPSSLIYPDLAL